MGKAREPTGREGIDLLLFAPVFSDFLLGLIRPWTHVCKYLAEIEPTGRFDESETCVETVEGSLT